MEKSRKIIYVLAEGLSSHFYTYANSLRHSQFPLNRRRVFPLELYDYSLDYLARLLAKL